MLTGGGADGAAPSLRGCSEGAVAKLNQAGSTGIVVRRHTAEDLRGWTSVAWDRARTAIAVHFKAVLRSRPKGYHIQPPAPRLLPAPQASSPTEIQKHCPTATVHVGSTSIRPLTPKGSHRPELPAPKSRQDFRRRRLSVRRGPHPSLPRRSPRAKAGPLPLPA
jgi:hypothetical protein